MPATLQTIADAVGVSRFSVSCALNGRDDQVSPATRARILAAARELGYRPNTAAKAARTGRFHAAALIQRAEAGMFSRKLFGGIDKALGAHGMHLAATNVTTQNLTDPERMPRLLRELCVDGLLINQALDVADDLARTVRDLGVPTIWLNAKEPFDSVYPEEEANVAGLTRRLLDLGHRRIAFVRGMPIWGSASNHFSHADRIEGYERTMREAGLVPRTIRWDYPVTQGSSPWGTPDDDRLLRARTLLSGLDRPTAIITPSMISAGPLLHTAGRLDLDVPRELSLVTISQERHQESGVPLSTAVMPFDRIGAVAVDLLLDRIADPARPRPSVGVPYDAPCGATLAAPPDP